MCDTFLKEGRAEMREGSCADGVWSRRKDMLGRRRTMWAEGVEERNVRSRYLEAHALVSEDQWMERRLASWKGWRERLTLPRRICTSSSVSF